MARFHVSIPGGTLDSLGEGETHEFSLGNGICGWIERNDDCPNFHRNGKGYLLNPFCPNEGDFEVHERKTK